jgi:hypothetical protein
LKDANEKVWNYDFTLILPSGRFSVCFLETHNNRKRGGKKIFCTLTRLGEWKSDTLFLELFL